MSRVLSQGVNARAMQRRMKFLGHSAPFGVGFSSASNDTAGTMETPIALIGDISRMALLFGNQGSSVGGLGAGETDGPNPNIMAASAVGADRAGVSKFAANGHTTFVHRGLSGLLKTDDLGFGGKAGDTIFVRNYARAALPPASPAAAAAAGGSLTDATYYFVITGIDNGIESGPTAEVSATTSGSNNAVALTWTDSASLTGYNIYMSAASGGTKQLIASIGGRAQKFIYRGDTTAVVGANPPAAQLRRINSYLLTGQRCNYVAAGGSGADQTGDPTTGTLNATGPSVNNCTAPFAILGDDIVGKSILTFGDSNTRASGFGDNTVVGFAQADNWNDRVLRAKTCHSLNAALNGGTNIIFLAPNASGVARSRLTLIQYADIVINANGINDVGYDTWQRAALAHMSMARLCYSLGIPYYLTTLPPMVTSTNGCIDIAGQSANVRESKRVSFNNWVRGGCEVDGSGLPVESGGTPFTQISGFIDRASVLEVNASNALTLNGGYMRVPTAAYLTGQVLAGSPSATAFAVSGTPYIASALRTMAIKMTSGARSGQAAIVAANTTSALTLYTAADTALTGIALPGLSGAPAAGDTFDIYEVFSTDGLHHTVKGHRAQADDVFGPFATNVLGLAA